MIKKILFLLLICNIAIAQERMSESEWIEKVMSQMNTQDKVSQLFVIRSKSDDNIEEINYIKNLLAKYAIGGVCFFQGTPRRQVELTNTYQSICKVPLMISMDAEWGTGMRLKNDGFSYPKNISLGAIQNNQLIYQTGYDIGLQLKRLGVHMNYAPCVDINLNPNNPVINERSFGSDKAEVTSKAFSYMYGLQDAGVLACLKHFPGHGDTETDSHYDLPVLLHSRERIDSIESFPYKVLTKYDVASLMVGHLHIPSLDSISNIPATLSPLIVKNLIRDSLKFEGLIITDALEMKGVTKNYTNGQLELMAFQAGNDILLLSENVEKSIGYLVAAIDSNKITLSDLDEKVRRILKAKYKVSLDQLSLISPDNIELDLKKPEFTAFKEKLYRESITLLKDFKNQIPVRNLDQKMVSISFNSESNSSFQNRIQSYKKVRKFNYKSGEIPI
jgi:beta-N-acetylhexosaminidase